MPEKWQRLHLSNQGTLPALLFKYSPTASGYELFMTDLTRIWSERLDRRDVLRRADEDDATIDPSEDAEQFRVLLQKIGEALHHEPGSNTALKQKASSGALELHISSQLPAPLKPLKWRMDLWKQPQSSTMSQLLLPLIKAEADRESRQQALIEELRKKDWVLGKLFDKIETMGIDLSTVFPSISGLRAGRKGTTLTQAAKYIKGVAPFDEQAWLDGVNRASPDSGLAANIVEVLGGSHDLRRLAGLKPPPEEWWEESLALPESTEVPLASSDDQKRPAARKTPVDAMETDSDAGAETEDDEFERQETPPRLKKPSEAPEKAPSPQKLEVTETDDEEPSEKKPPPAMRPKPQPPTTKTKGLGTIGGKKQSKQKQPSPTPTPPPPSKPEINLDAGDDDGDETTDSEHDILPKQPPPTKEPPKPAPKVSRRGLGVIGGKKKKEPAPEEQRTSSPSPSPEVRPTETEPEKKKKVKKPLGKLGVIGGKAAKRSVEPTSSRVESTPEPPGKEEKGEEEEEDTKSKFPTPGLAKSSVPENQKPNIPSAEPEREETEQEKADRKREELKRQLEAKSKAPAKKKRRF